MSTDAFLSLFMGQAAAERPDPVKAAQAGMKAPLPRRFYREAGVAERDGLFHLQLDGRGARTPARNPLAVTSRAVAEAMAEEWSAQHEAINPSTMPLTRLVNVALDGVARDPGAVRDEVTRYAGSDLVCYRALEPETLAVRQGAEWDPVVAWSREALGAPLALAAGVVHVAQDEASLVRIREAVEAVPAPLALTGLASITSLTGSALLALALARGFLQPDAAWEAAHVDETFQAQAWGRDEEAQARLDNRRRDFDAAAFLLAAPSS